MKQFRLMLPFVIGGIVFLTITGRVLAHHSFSATYIQDNQIEVEGTVKELYGVIRILS